MWFCIGFLAGMMLWTPFIVAARMEGALARLEGRILTQVLRVAGSHR